MDVEVENSGTPAPDNQLPRYVYKPLQSKDHIRLINLEPAIDTEAKIVLSLSEHKLADVWGVYEALSYTWGDPSNVRDITSFTPRMTPSPHRKSDSQGRGSKCPFELGAGFQQEGSYTTLTVTYNCYSALRRLRNHISPRTVWIDAICINHDDIPERNSQVAMMSLIYHQSRRLVIDVGDASPTSDAAIDFIVQYDQHREAGERDEHGVYDMITGLFIRDIICEFYARPWFSRIWVLQEAFLGVQEPWTRDSHGLPAWLNCGGRSVEWSKFKPLHINVDSRPAGETENWHIELPTVASLPLVLRIGHPSWGASFTPGRERSWPRYKDDGTNTFDLLCLARSNKATDPRDKVFALLPLQYHSLSPNILDGLNADYGKPVAEVYIETALWLLPKVGLSFLNCCGTMQENDHGILEELPSWVPDWNERYLEQWMIWGSEVYTPLQAGGDPPRRYCLLPTLPETVATTILDKGINNQRRAILKVRGVSVDKIKFVSGQINIRYVGDEECKNLVERCRLYHEGLTERFEDAAEGHMRLTGAARLPMPRPWKPKTGERRLHPPDWAAYEYGLPLENPETLTDNELCDYISFFTANRHLAMTDRGYCGVVPQKSSVGDQVCCFLGAGVPFVLRNRNDGKYTLIGESYVYGLMEGEAFGGADKANGIMETRDTVPIDPRKNFLIS